MRKPYRCKPKHSRGRLVDEGSSAHRSPFQRDRDRIIHSTAFRRLKHKTQVFVAHEGDHFRTRLTHTIEVAQVARTMAKALGLNVELSEAVALAHDLGHTPFGHVGEDALSAKMAPYGGFDHNAQALKIVTSLEHNYAQFDGLNLTWEALEGIAKHNGSVLTHASAEAQIAALSDDIAYNNHDLDDGLRAGLFEIGDIHHLPIVGDCFDEVDKKYPTIDQNRRHHEALRRVFGIMVEDVLTESANRLDALDATCAADIRVAGVPVIQFSKSLWSDLQVIRKFLFENMYRSSRVNVMRETSVIVVNGLFDAFMNDAALMPDEWAQGQGETAHARHVSDYIAGMTDGYAQRRYDELGA
ncbi:UNVERIFIED_CONTAM: hypothetical protein GTU68_016779 [Idotea baltica]|nr:hypothetical protein [Idotea baltica]